MQVLQPTLEPWRAAQLGRAAAQALIHFGSPTMHNAPNNALLTDLKALTKPCVFETLDALARRIHRDRKDDVLDLAAIKARFREGIFHLVRVQAEHPSSGRRRLIGFAWLNGKRREALEAALLKLEPVGAYEGVA